MEHHYLVTRVPVRADGKVLGAIGIAEATFVRDNYIRSTIRNSVLATVAMIATSGVGVLVLGVWLVGRPLRLLATKAKRVGQGDLSGPLELRQNDEIGKLAHEVNAMCERLAEANARTQAETTARIQTLEQLRHADRLITVLIIDDFGLDAMDATESRDAHEIFTERHRSGSMIVTSNRGPDEWLATFADPVRAQAAIDRFTSNAYDLVIDGESYRSRLKPKLDQPAEPRPRQRKRP